MLLATILAGTVLASAADPSVLIAQVERAVVMNDVELLLEYERELRVDHPDDRYSRAYVHWRLSYAVGPERKKEHSEHLKEARAILEELVADDATHAEAHALLGSVIGGQITNPFKGMVLGPKSTRALDRAFELEPTNPRVSFLQGVGAFFTPSMFGGGVDKAEAKLAEAEAFFAAEPPGKAWPSWGRVDVQAWMGVVRLKKGDRDGARLALEKGLAMEPDHAWIRNILLPQLDEH